MLSRVPGLGPRSARRAALASLQEREQLLLPLARAMGLAAEKIAICKECGNIDTQQPCAICQDPARDASLICVVEEVGDLWALERAGIVSSRYHVLGGTLSPLEGVGLTTFPSRSWWIALTARGAGGYPRAQRDGRGAVDCALRGVRA